MAIRLLSDSDQITVRDSDIIHGGDTETSYVLRKITPEKQRELLKKHTRSGNNRRGETLDIEALQQDQIDYVLVSWEGVLDNGQPAECSRANKVNGLDMARRLALIEHAGMTDIVAAAEGRATSFR